MKRVVCNCPWRYIRASKDGPYWCLSCGGRTDDPEGASRE